MANDLNVIYRIAADISGLQDGVNRAAKSTENLESMATRIGKAFAGAFSVHQVKEFVSETTEAFGQQEAATSRLTTALKAQGTFTPALAKQYDDLASTFERTTVFSDDLVTGMQALLVQVGNVMPGQMNAALEAATNLSAGLGIDLETSTRAVAKAFEGGGSAITKMLPGLKDLVKEGAPVEEVLAKINEKFGGQAAAQIETYDGKVKQLDNSLNNAQERIGKIVANGLTPMLDLFEKLPTPVQTVGGAMYTLAPNLESVALGLLAIGGPGKALALAGSAFAALPALIEPLLPIIGPVGWVVGGAIAVYEAYQHWDAITGFVKGVYDAVKSWLGDHLGEILANGGPVLAPILLVYTTFKNWDKIAALAEAVYTGVKTWLVDKFAAVVQSIRDKVAAVSGFFKDMYDKVVGHSYVPDLLEGIKQQFARLPQVMVDPSRKHTDAVVLNFAAMGTSIENTVRGTLGRLPTIFNEGFGRVLVNLKAIGHSLLDGVVHDILDPIMSYISGWAAKLGGIIAGAFGISVPGLGGALAGAGGAATGGILADSGSAALTGGAAGGGAASGLLGALPILGPLAAALPLIIGGFTNQFDMNHVIGGGGLSVSDNIKLWNQMSPDERQAAFDLNNPGISGAESVNLPTEEHRLFNPADLPSFAEGSGGVQDFGAGQLAMLHGREAVVTEQQFGAGGGSITIAPVLHVHAIVADRIAIARAVDNEFIPAILDAIRRDVGGVRRVIKRAAGTSAEQVQRRR